MLFFVFNLDLPDVARICCRVELAIDRVALDLTFRSFGRLQEYLSTRFSLTLDRDFLGSLLGPLLRCKSIESGNVNRTPVPVPRIVAYQSIGRQPMSAQLCTQVCVVILIDYRGRPCCTRVSTPSVSPILEYSPALQM